MGNISQRSCHAYLLPTKGGVGGGGCPDARHSEGPRGYQDRSAVKGTRYTRGRRWTASDSAPEKIRRRTANFIRPSGEVGRINWEISGREKKWRMAKRERWKLVGRCIGRRACCFLPLRLFGGGRKVFLGGRGDGRLWKSLARTEGELCSRSPIFGNLAV